ncbi:MAG: pyridoxal-phosphate dependent enzyme [Candidatus Odinarchaeota archaeon]|nr:pyridoxal-phosphate dependent enzyme [Candidatus Odinarchaeota archaeon]
MYFIPTFKDVLDAKKVVSKYLIRTPLLYSKHLSRILECDAYVKCENVQITGAFKVRGGVNLVSKLCEEERRKGVIAVSTGNHGLSVAYAASLFDVDATIVMPEKANPFKVQAIKDLGAKVVFHGKDYDEAKEWTEKEAAKEGYRYIHSGNEPYLIAGVGTLYLEILEDLPDVDVIIVPVGGGSGASAACIVAKTINPKIKVIGVQSSGAPAVYLSWKNRKIVKMKEVKTFAEGLATRAPFELTLDIMWKYLDNMILVEDEEIAKAIILLLQTIHQVAEGAGAAATAAALKIKEQIKGKKVALVLSGGNISFDKLKEIITKYS